MDVIKEKVCTRNQCLNLTSALSTFVQVEVKGDLPPPRPPSPHPIY